MAMVIDMKNAFYKHTGEFGEKKHLILTGHRDGSVCIWKFFEFQSVLINYKDEITVINYCSDGIAICTARGLIYIWDQFLSTCIKNIELSDLSFKLLSFHIVGLDYNQNKMLITTMGGDAIEIKIVVSSKKTMKAK